jgi:hypothetical protein
MTRHNLAPIFIVGCGRSGTTLLRLMLNRHPRIAIPGETWYFRYLDRQREHILGEPETSWRRTLGDSIEALATFSELGITRAQLDAELTHTSRLRWGDVLAVANRAFARAEGKPRWGDKTPGYVRRLPLIHREFPNALILHVIRDGRDVAASFFEQPFGPKSAIEAADYWRADVVRGITEGPALFAGRYSEVRYEELATQPEAVLRNVVELIGEEFDPAMLKERESDRKYFLRQHHWHEQTAKPVTSARIGRWRDDLTPLDAALFELEAGELLKRLGYPLETRKSFQAMWKWRHRSITHSKVRIHRAFQRWGLLA